MPHDDKQRADERLAFYRLVSKGLSHPPHPDDTDKWDEYMAEFRLEHSITDEWADELVYWFRRSGYENRRKYPHLYSDENLYVQFSKWAFAKNRQFILGQPEKSYLPIVKEYIRDEKIQDRKSMEILIRLLSTKQQGALTR